MHHIEFLRINFLGKIKESNQQFDNSENVPIAVGANWVIKGLDENMKGMKVGEEKTVELSPEKGFGDRNPDLIKLVPESEFRKHGEKPFPGMIVNADNLRGRVVSVSSGRVKVDFNHPLAGKVLIYNLKVKEKIEGVEEEIKAVVEFFSGVNNADAKATEKKAEITVPPILPPLVKKKIADEIIKLFEFESVKFSEVFEKPKES